MRTVAFRRERKSSGQRVWPVTIQQSTGEAVDSSGAPIDGWSNLVGPELMARRDITGLERFAGEQTTAGTDTIWTMGYRLDMDPDLVDVPKTRRLVYQSRVFDITNAAVVGNHEAIELSTLARSRVTP